MGQSSSSSAKRLLQRQPLVRRPSLSDQARVTVDPAALCCPICYSVYPSAPVFLHCGHSFCHTCLKNVTKAARKTPPLRASAADALQRTVECPLCRERFALPPTAEAPRNFAMEAVLASVAEVLDTDDCRTVEANTRVQNDRLKGRLADTHDSLRRQTAEIGELEARLARWKGLAAVLTIYLLVQWIRSYRQ